MLDARVSSRPYQARGRYERAVLLAVLMSAALIFPVSTTIAQEKSVRPGINERFRDPNVEEFMSIFEREGRQVYDSRHEIVTACRLKPGMVLADVGAGTGLMTRLFAPVVGKVYAVDISRKFIDHIMETCKQAGIENVEGIVCSDTSINLPRESIDVAFICDTYHHFEFPIKTMRSIHEALRPGGQVILIDFSRIEGKSSDFVMGHVRAGQEVFTDEIRSVGFEVVESLDFIEDSYFLRFKKVSPTTEKASR